MPKKLTTEEFIKKSITKHGYGTYDYSLVEYVNNSTKVKIICPLHGVFEQSPHHHIQGKGCFKCRNLKITERNHNRIQTTEEYIKKAKAKHGENTYDYSLVDYRGVETKIKIKCHVHGIFEQWPHDHLCGTKCSKCANIEAGIKRTMTQNEFVTRSTLLHSGKYDYSLSKYINAHTYVDIICPVHGVFQQTPSNHLNSKGCQLCNESSGEIKIRNYLTKHNINFIPQHKFKDCRNINPLPFDFYLPDLNKCIEYNGRQHYEMVEIYHYDQEALLAQRKRDQIKIDYCNKNNIPLLILVYQDDMKKKLDEFTSQ